MVGRIQSGNRNHVLQIAGIKMLVIIIIIVVPGGSYHDGTVFLRHQINQILFFLCKTAAAPGTIDDRRPHLGGVQDAVVSIVQIAVTVIIIPTLFGTDEAVVAGNTANTEIIIRHGSGNAGHMGSVA